MGKQYSESIMQTEKQCWYCGRKTMLERHHVMTGTANRKLSERFGLWIWCCHEDHVGIGGVQYDRKKSDELKADAQMAFEAVYGHDAWMKTFYRNYIL